MDQKYSDFAARLIETRLRQGIKQIQLCRMANISRNALVHYELGDRTPKAEILKKIADALNVTTDYLIYGINKNPVNDPSLMLRSYIIQTASTPDNIQTTSTPDNKKAFIMALLLDDYANDFINSLYDFLTLNSNTKEQIVSFSGHTETMNNKEYYDYLLMKAQNSLQELKRLYDKKNLRNHNDTNNAKNKITSQLIHQVILSLLNPTNLHPKEITNMKDDQNK